MLACGWFEHQKSKCSLFKKSMLWGNFKENTYSQEVEPKILAENATGYYNLYKLALWNPMKHQKKMKSVILFGKRNLNFFLRKPFKKKDLIFYAPYCWLWISLTLFMFPVWHKLLSSLKRTQISNAHWSLGRSFLLLSFLTSTGCKVIGS